MKNRIKMINTHCIAGNLKLVAITLFLISCSSGAYQLYSGPKRAANEISILTSFEPFRIIEIDGIPGPNEKYFGYSSTWNGKCIAELEPGFHEIVFISVYETGRWNVSNNITYYSPENIYVDTSKINYDFRPGKIYQIDKSRTLIEIKKIPSANKPYNKNNQL